MRRILVALVAMVATAGSAVADIDMNISGAGARAKGMGGAFIAVADDATAISWNPAGMAQLDRIEASVVGLFNIKSYSRTWNYEDGTNSSLDWDDEEKEPTETHFAPNFASLVFPFKAGERNIVLAVAYQRWVDFGSVRSDTGTSADPAWGHYDVERKQTGGIDAISGGLAIQLSPMVSVGGAANIIVRGSKITYEYDYDPGYSWDSEEQMTFSGFNVNTGMLLSPGKHLNLGLSLRLPFTLNRTSEAEWSWSGPYGSGQGDSTYPDPQRTWTFPLMFGAGIAVKPTDNVTIAFDYERRNYGSTEFTNVISDTAAPGGTRDVTYKDIWMSINQFRLGVEVLAVSPQAVFPIRFGIKTNPQIYPAVKWEAGESKGDSVVMTGIAFSAGFGVKMGSVWLDLAYEMSASPVERWEQEWTDGSKYKYQETEISHSFLASCVFHF